jgi:hypothetical protein
MNKPVEGKWKKNESLSEQVSIAATAEGFVLVEKSEMLTSFWRKIPAPYHSNTRSG